MTNVYREHVERTIHSLKSFPAGEVSPLPIELYGRQIARLEPVSWRDADNSNSIRLLAQWREGASEAFPVVFPVTLEGTKNWLRKQLLELSDRLLFWVVSEQGEKIGHAGLFRFDFESRQTEIDNIVRGVPGVSPGAMEAAVRTLIDWSIAELEIRDVFLRVFSDNPRAIRLYERCGFQETMRMPLARVQDGEIVRWIEVDGTYRGPVKRYFVTMHLPAEAWKSHRAGGNKITLPTPSQAA